jgi:hypothetical protein
LVQIHRREAKTSGGVQIKGNSGFVPGQLLHGSLVPYRASIVALHLHEDCPAKPGEDSLRARRPPWECSMSESARNGLFKQNGRPVGSAAWSEIASSSARASAL